MVTNRLRELAVARAKLASLEARVAALRNAELSGLPDRYGFDDAASFGAAVKAAARAVAKWKRRGVEVTPSGFERKRRRRAAITGAIRAKVKALTKAKKTAVKISQMLRISEPSVHRIRKALGLVRKRGK